jgi:hypothetical protein
MQAADAEGQHRQGQHRGTHSQDESVQPACRGHCSHPLTCSFKGRQAREQKHRNRTQKHCAGTAWLVIALFVFIPVFLQERLSTCALVCRTWATASAGASTVLTVQLRSQAQADSLAAWLTQYGSSIEQLSVATDHLAYQESLLQWQRQRARRGDDGVDVVVSQVEDSWMAQMLAGYKVGAGRLSAAAAAAAAAAVAAYARAQGGGMGWCHKWRAARWHICWLVTRSVLHMCYQQQQQQHMRGAGDWG